MQVSALIYLACTCGARPTNDAVPRAFIGRAVTGLDSRSPDLTYGGPGVRPVPREVSGPARDLNPQPLIKSPLVQICFQLACFTASIFLCSVMNFLCRAALVTK